MKRFVFLILALCLPAEASQIITATITVTNAPAVDADTVVVNGDTRTWRSSVTVPASEISISSSIGGSATNLFNQVAAFPFTTLTLARSGTNAVTLRGIVDQSITISIGGTWGEYTLSTQTVTTLQAVRVPISGEPLAVARTNIPSLLVTGLNSYSQNALSQVATVAGELLGTTNTQTISGKKTWTGSNVFLIPVTSNLVNYGAAITSPGTGSDSEQFGSGAVASGSRALALGKSASATNSDSIAIGNLSISTGESSIGIGTGVVSDGTNSIAIGASAETDDNGISIGTAANVSADDGISLGNGASVTHTNSVAIGNSVASTAANQVRIGTSSHTVSIPGILSPAVTTNSTYHGTIGLLSSGLVSATVITNSTVTGTLADNSTHTFNSTIKRTRLDHTSLANGNNAGVDFSTNSFVKLSAGPTGAFTINGIIGGSNGRELIIYNSIAQNMTIANESGVDATAANRIVTMTGADVTSTGVCAAHLIYDSGQSRWLLLYLTP